jgi:hypothetical protein
MSNHSASAWRLRPRVFAAVCKSALAILPMLCLIAAPVWAGPMKLLTPKTRWLSYGNKLFWITDGGDGWTQITPRPPGLKFAQPGHPTSGAGLAIVFFRNTSEGWVVVSYPEQTLNPQVEDDSKMAYILAHWCPN